MAAFLTDHSVVTKYTQGGGGSEVYLLDKLPESSRCGDDDLGTPAQQPSLFLHWHASNHHTTLQQHSATSASLSYLSLPYLQGGCLLGRHPALRPQHGPSAHPQQTSRPTEPLWSFGKPQEEKPMDITQHIQWESKTAKYLFPKKH